MKKLKKLLPEMQMFKASKQQKQKYKMGGLAIIDQIICSHARYFTGIKCMFFFLKKIAEDIAEVLLCLY